MLPKSSSSTVSISPLVSNEPGGASPCIEGWCSSVDMPSIPSMLTVSSSTASKILPPLRRVLICLRNPQTVRIHRIK